MSKDTILTLIEWVAEERKIYTLRVVNPGPNAKSRVSSVRTDPEGIRARRLIRLGNTSCRPDPTCDPT